MDFNLNLVITEKCNCCCKYCYMDHNPKTMTTDIVDMAIKQMPKILDMFGFYNYRITYFGGEPLENFELIKYTHKLDKPLCINEVMISNLLLLTEDKLNYFKESNIGISWSFDGLWNKFNRPLANGSSSLELALEKLPLIQQLTQGCKVMVSPSSLDTFVENFKFLVDRLGIICPDYSLVRDDIWTDDDIKKFENKLKELSKIYINYYRVGIKINFGMFMLPIMDIIVGQRYGKRKFCCFAGDNGIAVMPNGDMYACARFGTNKLYCYGNIKDTIELNKFKQINSEVYLDPRKFDKCKECKLYNYCNAGCTFSQIQNGRKPIDSICKLYHIMYKEALYVYNELKKDTDYQDYIFSCLKNGG